MLGAAKASSSIRLSPSARERVLRENGGKKRPLLAIEIHAEGRPWLPNRKRVDATRLSAASGPTEEAAEPSGEEQDMSVD
jgi:hypothetical protein